MSNPLIVKAPVVDKANSLYNVGIYFYNQMTDYQTSKKLFSRDAANNVVPKQYQKYHLKFVNHKDYVGLDSEMKGLVDIIKKNKSNNLIKRVLLYQNRTKTGTGENPQMFRVEFKENLVTDIFLNPKLPENWVSYFNGVIEEIKKLP